MTVFLILISFLLGVAFGKRLGKKAKKPPKKAREISNIAGFLNYDGREQTN